MQVARPELAHRNVQMLLVQERVFRNLERHPRRFAIASDSLLAQKLRRNFVMVVGKHVGQRASKVPEKTIANLRTDHHAASECRQIWSGVVATPPLKL